MTLKKKIIIGVFSFALVVTIAITAVFAANSATITAQATVSFAASDVQGFFTKAANATDGKMTFGATESDQQASLLYTLDAWTRSNETRSIVVRVYNTGGTAMTVTFPTLTCTKLNITYSIITDTNATPSTTSLVVANLANSPQGTADASCHYAQCTYTFAIKNAYTNFTSAAISPTGGKVEKKA